MYIRPSVPPADGAAPEKAPAFLETRDLRRIVWEYLSIRGIRECSSKKKNENPTVGSRDFAESVEMYFIKRAAQNSARVGRLIATSGAFKAAFCYTFAVSRSLSLSSLSLYFDVNQSCSL